jgi:hypothetical protein
MKPGRKAETTVKSEVGSSRKAKIASMFAGGATQLAVWRAMEVEYPQTIADEATRSEVCKELGIGTLSYDAAERERLGWAIRQIKGLMLKSEGELDEALEAFGAGDAKSAADIEFTNRSRFLSGIPGLDHIYGHTVFKWLADAPNSKYKTEVRKFFKNEEEIEREVEVWVSGDYRKGDMMPLASQGRQDWNPNGIPWTVTDKKFAYQEKGFPVSFLSLWGGAPGVGKTRLAIELSKALNRNGQGVLYFNGEADEQDFRGWLGADIDDNLFKVVSGEMIRTENAVEQIYRHTPRVVIFDSLQMLAEVAEGGARGCKTAMSRFKVLKADEDAGRPHLLFISQLNKKEELAGSRYLEHMVDMAAHIKKVEGRKKQFLFEVPRKNRGAETGVGLPFEHSDDGVRCIATDSSLRTEPIYKSLTQVNSGAIAEGVQSAPQ